MIDAQKIRVIAARVTGSGMSLLTIRSGQA